MHHQIGKLLRSFRTRHSHPQCQQQMRTTQIHSSIGKIQLLGSCTSTIFPVLAYDGEPMDAELSSSMAASGESGREIIIVWFPLDEQFQEIPSSLSPHAEHHKREHYPTLDATDDLLLQQRNDDMPSIVDEAYQAAYDAWVATGHNQSILF